MHSGSSPKNTEPVWKHSRFSPLGAATDKCLEGLKMLLNTLHAWESPPNKELSGWKCLPSQSGDTCVRQ